MLPDLNIESLDYESSNHAYDRWDADEQNCRRFLLTSNIGMTAWFEQQEESANREGFAGVQASEAHGDEGHLAYMNNVGLLKEDYWPALSASTVKSAVSFFEIYMEDSADEILQSRGWCLKKKLEGKSWNWEDCARFFESFFTVDITPPEVESIRWIRNKLTHLNDTLRTPEDEIALEGHRATLGLDTPETDLEKPFGLYRFRYEPLAGLPNLQLTPLDAWRILEVLRSMINQLAPHFGRAERRQVTTEALDLLEKDGVVPSACKSIQRTPEPSEQEKTDLDYLDSLIARHEF